MGIPESQLETWTSQGAPAGSAATYQTIRSVLNSSNSPFYAKSFEVFLQGSYGNDTNVWRDSDVDIVIQLDETYYYDNNELSEGSKTNFAKSLIPVTYSYDQFKSDVFSWLKQHFGSSVTVGTKAISIAGSGNRRNADVLVCAQYRNYWKDSNGNDHRYTKGICFWRNDGRRIENYPKQHSENCTSKHQGTSSRFKPMVRVYKNIRNRMVDEKVIGNGVAPSYFVEGMLWNAPTNLFTSSKVDTFVGTLSWIIAAERDNLTTASNCHWLVRDGYPECWPVGNFNTFVALLTSYWNNWGK